MPLPIGDGLGWAVGETEPMGNPFGGPLLGLVAKRCGHTTRLLGDRHHDSRSCANAYGSNTASCTCGISTRSSIVAVSVV